MINNRIKEYIQDKVFNAKEQVRGSFNKKD